MVAGLSDSNKSRNTLSTGNERVHLQFCKRLLGVKICTLNDFVYRELGRMDCQYVRYFIIIKYWVKRVHAYDNNYVKKCITC